MKVSIGSRIIEGPWGGGNLFVKNLSKYLIDSGHEVLYDLSDSNIDLILLTDPRSRKESSSAFNHNDINIYKKYINPNAKVVQRINECDERKGTNNINKYYLEASNCADAVVFVSSWLEKIYLNLGLAKNKTCVILSGSDTKVFKNYNLTNKINSKTKIVTHHWSSHHNKGFDIYRYLDDLISTQEWKDKIEFTYIGNISSDFNFKNTKVVQPLSGQELAKKISENDIYLTASINEPSGNHHIEGALCGLPILYKESGGIPEYCKSFGVSFNDKDDFELKLFEIIKNKEKYIESLKNYPFNAEKMNKNYINLFYNLLDEKKRIKPTNKNIKFYYFLLKFKFFKILRKFSIINLLFLLKNLIKNVR